MESFVFSASPRIPANAFSPSSARLPVWFPLGSGSLSSGWMERRRNRLSFINMGIMSTGWIKWITVEEEAPGEAGFPWYGSAFPPPQSTTSSDVSSGPSCSLSTGATVVVWPMSRGQWLKMIKVFHWRAERTVSTTTTSKACSCA